MTEYEMAELVNSGIANMLAGQAIYFTQLGSYLLVAWFVGAKLTRFQAAFLSILFLVLTFAGMSNFLTLLLKNFALLEQLREMGSITAVRQVSEAEVISSVFVGFRVIIAVAALLFMWQVRHPKAE
jgi:hypothetical protein